MRQVFHEKKKGDWFIIIFKNTLLFFKSKTQILSRRILNFIFIIKKLFKNCMIVLFFVYILVPEEISIKAKRSFKEIIFFYSILPTILNLLFKKKNQKGIIVVAFFF